MSLDAVHKMMEIRGSISAVAVTTYWLQDRYSDYMLTTGPLQWLQCNIWGMCESRSILLLCPISDSRVIILCAVTPGTLQ